MKKLILAFITATIFFSGYHIQAQTIAEREILASLVEEEQEAINALVLYPTEIRTAILESTRYVEALLKIESIQTSTRRSFTELLEVYPLDIQKMVWDLARYPGLINGLANLEDQPIAQVLNEYPTVIHPRAEQVYYNHESLLWKVDELNSAAESAFISILENYPEDAQGYFRQLLDLPEVLSILTENIRMTILVGDMYKNNPDWIIAQADSLNLEVVRQNAKDLEDWKESFEKDPAAFEEMQASAASYTDEYEYDDEYYDEFGDDLYYDESSDRYYNQAEEEVNVQHHYYYHYPYWFGYPTWYEYPYWRPRPYWYDWGFYYRPGRTFVIIGLPSIHFTHWYFQHAHHHTYWPRLSAHFVRHYNHHPSSYNSITNSVTRWHKKNAGVVSNRWLSDDGQLDKRFVEYGKFENARAKYNQRNPKNPVSQREFVLRNSPRYPDISKSATEIRKMEPTRKIESNKIESKRKTTGLKDMVPSQKKVPKKEEIRKKIPRKTITPKTLPKVEKGKDYHKDTWQKAKTKRTPASTPKINPKANQVRKKKMTPLPKTTKRKTVPRKKEMKKNSI